MAERPEHIGQLIKMLNEITEKNANHDLQDKDVTLAQMKMLIVLEQSEGQSRTLKELERIFGMTQATIAGTAARLEKKGLAEGYIDQADRRIKHIRITEKGLDICRTTRTSIDEHEAEMVQMLTEEEQAELIRLLLKVYDGLTGPCGK